MLNSTGTTLGAPVTTAIPSNSSTRGKAAVADLDGDGLEDFVYATGGTIYWMRRDTSGSFAAADDIYTIGTTFNTPFGTHATRFRSKFRFVNLDNDARADLLVRSQYQDCEAGSCTTIVEYTGIASVLDSPVETVYIDNPDRDPLSADLNGDGLTDFVWVEGGKWHVSINGGDHDTGVFGISGSVMSLDYDGDGKSDVLASVSGSSNWWMFRSTGTTLEGAVDTGIANTGYPYRVADTNGDGLSDIIHYVLTGATGWKHFFHKGPKPDLAVGFMDSLQNEWLPTYSPLTDAAVYTKGTGAATPNIRDWQGAMYVVSGYDTPDGLGAGFPTTVTYANARIDATGRGFLGFGSVRSVDGRNAIRTTRTYSQTFPNTGMLLSARVQQGASPNHDIVLLQHSLSSTALGAGLNQRHFAFVSGSTTDFSEVGGLYDGVLFKKAEVTYLYDAYGNVDQEVRTTGPADAPNYFTSTVNPSLTDYIDTEKWCLGRPTAVTVTNVVNSGTPAVRSTTATFDGTTCRVLTESVPDDTNAYGPDLALTTVYSYDAYGNVSQVASTGHDGTMVSGAYVSTTRTTSTSYSGTNGYLPSSVTNSLDHVTSMTWDRRFASPETVTDPNGLVTTIVYDDFGRVIRRELPVGVAQVTDHEWFDGVAAECQSTLLCIKVLNRTQRLSDEEFSEQAFTVVDPLGRAKRSSRLLLGGQWSVANLTYDEEGRVSEEEVPHFSGGTVYKLTRVFDLVGRVLSETRPASEAAPTGSVTAFEYEKFVTRATDPMGHVTERTINARGEVQTMLDAANGSTNYSYDPFGNLVQTVDAASNAIAMTYDARGNKRTMVDPDMGTWTYEYNAFGELTKQTDAKAQATLLVYDKLGRLKERTEPGAGGDCIATWTFDSATHGKGRLASVATNAYCDPFAESYTYDALSRPLERTTTIDSTAHVATFAYDTFARPAGLTYPASTGSTRFGVTYHYDSAGILSQVKDAATPTTVYWTNDAVNALGQVTQESFGNGVSSVYGFDLATGRLGSIASGPSSTPTSVQDLSFAWDAEGNLTQRAKGTEGGTVTALAESFCHDALHRLTLASLGSITCGTTQPSISYNAIGNILTKDGTTYSYGLGSAGPHAVTETTGSIAATYEYDANGNMVEKNGETLTWTSANYLRSVALFNASSTFSYAPSRQRFKQVTVDHASATATTIYLGGILEKHTKGGVTEWRHFIQAGGRTVAQHTRKSSGSPETRYLHRDHLGSVESITNESGTRIAQLSFDAFGRRREGETWTLLAWNDWTEIGAQTAVTPRGYTGHEMLDEVGLVHMNGRVYDPFLARMISADPTIPGPMDGQTFNRYAYVLNNPLSLVDPSGFGPAGICDGSPSCTPAADGSGGYDFSMRLPYEYIQCANGANGMSGCNSERARNYRGPTSIRGFNGIRFISSPATRFGVPAAVENIGFEPTDYQTDLGLTTDNADENWEPNDSNVYEGEFIAIFVGYTDAFEALGAEHALVVAVDVLTGEAWASRGGSSYGKCESCGFGLGFGTIFAEDGAFNEHFRDTPAETVLEFAGFVALSMQDFQRLSAQVVSQVNARRLPYLVITFNSNSFAYSLSQRLGLSGRAAHWAWVPGWGVCIAPPC